MAGVDGMTSVNLTGRQQWAFMPKNRFIRTPQTSSISASTRIVKAPGATRPSKGRSKIQYTPSGRVAMGASIWADKNGPISKTGLQLVYTYHIPIRNAQLSFGLAGLGYQFKISGDDLDFDSNPNSTTRFTGISDIDQLIDRPFFLLDAATGLNFSTHKFHIGLAGYQLFQAKIKFGNSEGDIKQNRYYNLSSTYKFNWHNHYTVEPSVIVRFNESQRIATSNDSVSIFQSTSAVADFACRLVYRRMYWGGAAIRSTGDFVFTAGMKMRKWYIAYSLDYGINRVTLASFGSHEILMAIKFGDSTRRYRWWERY